MTNQIPGGHFLMSRKVFESAIWGKPPQYYRLLSWLIGKAVFRDGYTFKGHVLKRGELITTHGEIADALSYRLNRAIKKPSLKEIRIMLSWLQSEGMILVKPVTGATLPNKGRPKDLTRACIGLLIFVINYDTYQDSKSYKGRHKGRPMTEQGQLEEEGEEECINILSNSIEVRLSELLFEKIISRNPNHKKPNLQIWAKDVDRMIRIDHRTPEEIRAVIEWCQVDTFWQNNILSTAKLRSKFDQLRLKMKTNGKQAAPVSPLPPLTCPRCGRDLVVKNDLYIDGCIYCQRAMEAHT
jgi:hypothetical protein